MIEGWGCTVHSIVVSWVYRHVCILFSLHLPKSVWFLHGLSHPMDHTDMFEEKDLRSLRFRNLSWLSVQYVDQKAVSPIAQMTSLKKAHMDPENYSLEVELLFRSQHLPTKNTFILEKPMIDTLKRALRLVRCCQPLLGDCWGPRFACWNRLFMMKQWSILISQNMVKLYCSNLRYPRWHHP